MSDHIGDGDLLDDAPQQSAATPRASSTAKQASTQAVTTGVDVLSIPEDAHRPSTQRAGNSRLGTVVVLLITAAVVLAGVWLVNLGKAADSVAQTGAGTAVSMPGTSGFPAPAVGKPAQDFTVTTYDGKKVSLSDYRGKSVWLTFGASWCTGCQAELPDIEAASKAYADKNVVVLGINISEDNTAVKSYAERIGLTFPIAADTNNAVADMYAVSAIPSHFFINSEGVITEIRIGALSPTVMSASLDKLVAS